MRSSEAWCRSEAGGSSGGSGSIAAKSAVSATVHACLAPCSAAVLLLSSRLHTLSQACCTQQIPMTGSTATAAPAFGRPLLLLLTMPHYPALLCSPADFRDHTPEPLADIYQLYAPVVQARLGQARGSRLRLRSSASHSALNAGALSDATNAVCAEQAAVHGRTSASRRPSGPPTHPPTHIAACRRRVAGRTGCWRCGGWAGGLAKPGCSLTTFSQCLPFSQALPDRAHPYNAKKVARFLHRALAACNPAPACCASRPLPHRHRGSPLATGSPS